MYVIGDGYTDYEIKHSGLANKFLPLLKMWKGEYPEQGRPITPSLDEFLYLNNLNPAISYPKNRINVLLLESVHPAAVRLMKEEGFNGGIPCRAYRGGVVRKDRQRFHIGHRSKTQVTARVIENAHRLMAIGAFCIGTNQQTLTRPPKRDSRLQRALQQHALGGGAGHCRNHYADAQPAGQVCKNARGRVDKSANNSFEIRAKTWA